MEMVKLHSMVPLLVLAETQLKSRRVLCVFPFCLLVSSFLPVPVNFRFVVVVISHDRYVCTTRSIHVKFMINLLTEVGVNN